MPHRSATLGGRAGEGLDPAAGRGVTGEAPLRAAAG